MSRHAVDQPTTAAATAGPDRFARLMLRDELYLLAHDDDSGAPHLNEQVLEVGLAGAVLLDLWLAGRVVVGWTTGARGQWVQLPGALRVYRQGPVDDLGASAVALIGQIRSAVDAPEQLRRWLREFAGTDLYVRVQAAMTVAGILRRTERRGRHLYLPREQAWPVRARAMIRQAVARRADVDRADTDRSGPGPVDAQLGAVCALAGALALAELLYEPSMPTRQVDGWLRQITSEQPPAVRQVAAAVDEGRGDLAVAALR